MKSTPLQWILGVLFWSITLVAPVAQELNCRVDINTSSLQGSNTQVFETLKQSVTEYLNDREWSDVQMSVNERIECSMVITLKEMPSQDYYKGELQVQVRRPVYNATYSTTLFNFRDVNLEFTYQEFDPLVFTENSFENNLTAILNFYAYIILGIDFDSFSPSGGTPYFQQALNVANLAQSAAEVGWKSFDDTRNRYALVSAFTEPRTAPFRELWYNYHRMGLDEMALSMEKGRSKITTSLKLLTEIYDSEPTSVLLPIFVDSKIDELVNIYSEAPTDEKEEVYSELMDIYPTEGNRLQKIKLVQH